MAMKLPPALAKNKGAVIAVGVGGAAALFLAMKGKGSSTTPTDTTGTPANPASLNTQATDLSAVTSNWSQDLSNQLSQNTTSIQDALKANQAAVDKSAAAAEAARKAADAAAAKKAPAALPKLWYTGTKAKNDDTLAAISRKLGVSLAVLRKLNPSLVGKKVKTGQKVLL